MTETILVTGGAGFIGSHVCKTLARRGYLPVTFDNLSTGHRWAVRWGPLETGELTDGDRLDRVMAEHRPTTVIHLAGYIAAGESVTDPGKYYANNIAGLLSLLDAMRRHHVERVVFSSSAAVYGAPEVMPIPESAPFAPLSPYGHSKAMSEQILRDYAAAHGTRSISLRYFNAAGADPEGEIGENHLPETHLIPLVLEAAAGQRDTIDVFGNDHDTPDGTCIRDYVHVTDLATAHVQAVQRLNGIPEAKAYNLGNGNGASVLEVIHAAEQAAGRRIATQMRAARPGDPPRLVADPRRAAAELDWCPAFPQLSSQVEHAWRWIGARRAEAVG